MKQMWRSMVLLMMLLGVLATTSWGSQPSTQWTVSAGYPGTPYQVVTDEQRNVYVTGTTYSADTNTSTSTADMLTAKYDANGNKLWEIRYNGPYNGFDAGYTIAVDEGGNVFVAGASSNGSSTNAIFAKYNPDGQELWFQRYTENQNFPSSCGTLSLDDAGNVLEPPYGPVAMGLVVFQGRTAQIVLERSVRPAKLLPGEDIVLVIATSSHREAAFEACWFLIDWLKTRAPFWKLEEGGEGASWVAAKDSDDAAASRWIRDEG